MINLVMFIALLVTGVLGGAVLGRDAQATANATSDSLNRRAGRSTP